MCIDPNAILILQEVSLDLLCDVCVEIGRERRLARLTEEGKKKEDTSFGRTGKVNAFECCNSPWMVHIIFNHS